MTPGKPLAPACGHWMGRPKPGCEEIVQYRVDPEDWEPCTQPVSKDGMCEHHVQVTAYLKAFLEAKP